MIQRRVKWKEGVAAENGVQAGKGLGNSREAGGGWGGQRVLLSVARPGAVLGTMVKSWNVGVRPPFSHPVATH